jgi:superfamily II DNA or RNA helicase
MPADVTGLRGVAWQLSYRTSMLRPDGRPLDILHEFYIPALQRSVRYDRVAGYFRSTSLAAASQGFSAFVGRQGHMRLIVGADMEPEDVRAILQGDEARLTRLLNAQLEASAVWPEDIRHGVELLAWMVTQGYLEVRVAFRVHMGTGDPIAVDALDDGYVHMKWAIFTDQQGYRLYASGSLNESRTALSLNAENIDVHCDWHGETDRRRVEEAVGEFDALWDNRHPAFKVLTLPEAVRQRLITMVERVSQPTEIDGSSAAPHQVSPPSAIERLRFALLRDGPHLPGGRYVGLETAPITPWPHQAIVARRLIATWPYSYLLCDEVGLGKTIEAGLAIRSLYLAGLAGRVLICAPASLTEQWQREMATKFLLPFGLATTGGSLRHTYLLPVPDEQPAASLYDPPLVIISTALVARRDRRPDLSRMPTVDITLVDEAHATRRRNPSQGSRADPDYGHLYRAIVEGLRPKSRSLWLTTATPMQLEAVEVADLLALTRRVGAFQWDASLMASYYEIISRLLSRRPVTTSEWNFLRRAVLAIGEQDPVLWSYLQQVVIDARTRLAARQWLEQERIPRGTDLQGVLRLLFAAAPLSRVMLRHTRPLLEIYQAQGQLREPLARRQILPIPSITMTEQERQAYEQLEVYCRGLAAQMARQGAPQGRSAVGFLLSFLRLRFASSLFAIRETVRRRLERVDATLAGLAPTMNMEADEGAIEGALDDDEDDHEATTILLQHRTPEDLRWERLQLRAMLRTLADLSGTPSKMMHLLRVLNRRRIAGTGRIQQTVIFTRFYDTLSDLVARLQRAAPGVLIGTYSGRGGQYWDVKSGRLVGVDREEVKHRFMRGEIDMLVCTDAAAEGLNLQTADWLINFDLPWNPMKVEQRIGRIDRIGQRHAAIYVLNLCYVDSAEQIVYERLLRRLADAGEIVGMQQLSLLPVTHDEFLELAQKTLSEAELERRAGERVRLARQRTASMEIPPQELYQMYLRLAEQADLAPPPVDLEAIWETLSRSASLRDLGCRVHPDADQQVLMLVNIPGVLDGTALTTARATYDAGIADFEGRLHFGTYGDPVFETVLRQIEAFPLPGCIHRMEVQVPGASTSMVGYAAAERTADGLSRCRLVTSVHDLATLELDETVELRAVEMQPAHQALTDLARRESSTTEALARVEAANERAGHAQVLLDYLVARDLLRSRQQTGSSEPAFWREVATLEEICRRRELIRVRRIPVALGRHLSGLLFDLRLPTTGEEGYADAPQPLLLAALDAVCRLANAMQVRRSELLTSDVLERLERMIERRATT